MYQTFQLHMNDVLSQFFVDSLLKRIHTVPYVDICNLEAHISILIMFLYILQVSIIQD